MNLRSDPTALRKWALFIQAADFEIAAEDDLPGETVREALWDAAFLTPLSRETVAALESIARGTNVE